MKRAVLVALVALCSVAYGQPTTIAWRPPTGCSNGQAIVWNSSTSRWECGSAGSSFTTANAIPKGNGSGMVASLLTDDANTVSIATPNAGTGMAAVTWSTGGWTVFGANAASATGAAIGIGYSTTSDEAQISVVQPSTGWKPLHVSASNYAFKIAENNGCTLSAGSVWNCTGGLQVNGTSVNTFTTNNTIPKGNGTGLASSTITDNGTTVATTASTTLGDSTTSDTHTINGYTQLSGGGTSDVIRAWNTASASTTTGNDAIDARGSGTYNTTAATIENTAVGALANATRSSGANSLINYAVYSSASGGQTNYDFFGAAGLFYQNDAANFYAGVTLGDATSDSHVVNGNFAMTSSGSGNTPFSLTVGSSTLGMRLAGGSNEVFQLGTLSGTISTYQLGPSTITGTAELAITTTTATFQTSVNAVGGLQENGAAVLSGTLTDDYFPIGSSGNVTTSILRQYTGAVSIATTGNELHFEDDVVGVATGYLNYYGTSGGTTQYRNLIIANGRGTAIATFNGDASGGTTTFTGTSVTMGGTLTVAGDVNDSNGAVVVADDFSVTGNVQGAVTSPTSITVSQDNYTGCASNTKLCRITSTGSVNITGLTGGTDGRELTVCNIGTNDIVLKNENASSTAANRITTLNQSVPDQKLFGGTCASMVYSSTTSRWLVTTLGATWIPSLIVASGLTVESSGTTTNSLAVTADASVGGATTFTGKLIATGTDPSISSCGTSPTVVGNDTAGIVTVGTGTATSCTVTFSSTYTAEPACVVTLSGSSADPLYFSAKSATAFTVSTAGALNLQSMKFNYVCFKM